MKRHLLLLIAMLCMGIIYAQEPAKQQQKPRMTHKEFRAKQQEFITQQAKLSEEESAAFFPLYFELQNKKHAANRRVWKQARAVPPHDRTEEECDTIIMALAEVKIECATLEKEYLNKFREILSPKKLMCVQMVEDRFQRELLRSMQQGKKNQGETQP